MAGRIRIGISGWRYAGWRGVFYPPKLPQRRELEFASHEFDTVELNGSFYSMQRPESFGQWCEQTPDDFVFAIKGSRFITHMKKLRDFEAPLANFFAQGLLRLGPKLGPILWQFPPNFTCKPEVIEPFLKALPKTQRGALRIARKHDARLDGRDWLKVREDLPMRHAFEIRHESFVCTDFIELLTQYEIGLVVADTVEWPLLMDVTAPFVYVRLHGSEQLYTSGYEDVALDLWADRVVTWAEGREVRNGRRACEKPGPKCPERDVYVYFDNDAKVRAPFDAKGLRRKVDALLEGRIRKDTRRVA